MPGFTTHYIFGMKAYNDMPFTPLNTRSPNTAGFYQLGLQGPDMFFYNIPILRHRDYRNVGSYMHEHKVNALFECCLRRIGTIRSRQQQEEAISYLTGFINHYIADSICHPIRVRAHRLSSGCPDLHASRDARTSGKRARRDPALEI